MNTMNNYMPTNEEIENLKNTMHKLDLTNIYRNSTQQQQNTVFSSMHGYPEYTILEIINDLQ